LKPADLQETDATPLDRIAAIVREVLDDDAIELALDSRPREIEGWDSLANVSIVFGIEESFGVRLGSDVLVGFETIGRLVQAVDCAGSDMVMGLV
jgi:acyl carrier protein